MRKYKQEAACKHPWIREIWSLQPALTWCNFGLIAHNSNGSSIHPGKSNHYVSGIGGHDLKEFPLVNNLEEQKLTRSRVKRDRLVWSAAIISVTQWEKKYIASITGDFANKSFPLLSSLFVSVYVILYLLPNASHQECCLSLPQDQSCSQCMKSAC